MRRFSLIFTLMFAVCSLPANLTAAPVANKPLAIIMGAKPIVSQINRGKLKLIYLRKQRYWPKGVPIKPVNLQSSSSLRQHFSKVVIGSAPNTQVQYWNGQYFNGILPPYVVNSEEAVMRYVANTKGAIGYVDACKLDKRVKAVGWIINQTVQTSAPSLNCR